MSDSRATTGSVRLAYLLLCAATLAWGGNAVAGRMAAGEWPPFTLTAMRWGLAVLIILPFAWAPMVRERETLKHARWVLMALGAFGMAGFNLCLYLALNYTTAINVSIEQASMPVLIMLANFVVFSQSVRALQMLGVVLSIVGVLVTTTEGQPLTFFTSGLNRGDAIMLFGCVFYAGYTFALRWKPDVHWLSFIWWVSLGAFFCAIPFATWELWLGPYQEWRISERGTIDWMVMVYVVIFPTIVSQIAYARGVEILGGNRAGIFINLVPVFGSVLAILILKERFEWYHGLGMALVIGGIMMAERAGRQ